MIQLYCNMSHCCHIGDLKNTRRCLKSQGKQKTLKINTIEELVLPSSANKNHFNWYSFKEVSVFYWFEPAPSIPRLACSLLRAWYKQLDILKPFSNNKSGTFSPPFKVGLIIVLCLIFGFAILNEITNRFGLTAGKKLKGALSTDVLKTSWRVMINRGNHTLNLCYILLLLY